MATRIPEFRLPESDFNNLRRSNTVELRPEPQRKTIITLKPEIRYVTVLTVFPWTVSQSSATLKRLNEANKEITLGGFLLGEQGELSLRTSSYYPQAAGDIPDAVIVEIMKSHYTQKVEDIAQTIRTSRNVL